MGNLNDASPLQGQKHTTVVNQDGIEVKVETTVKVKTTEKPKDNNESKDSDVVYHGRLE